MLIDVSRNASKRRWYFDVRVLDHFVVGDGEVISFAERGWL